MKNEKNDNILETLNIKPKINGDTLMTTQLLAEIFENRNKIHNANLAYSAHKYLAKGLAYLAMMKAQEFGVKNIGFTGGVAYNEIINSEIKKIVLKDGFNFLVHKQVPPGDGGVSFGQVVAAAFFPF